MKATPDDPRLMVWDPTDLDEDVEVRLLPGDEHLRHTVDRVDRLNMDPNVGIPDREGSGPT